MKLRVPNHAEHSLCPNREHHLTERRQSYYLTVEPPDTMAPKKNARESANAAPAVAAPALAPVEPAPVVKPAPTKPKASEASTPWDKVLINLYNHYIDETPQRTKLLDVFLVFLAAVGALQFLYCVLAGNYVRRMLPRGSSSPF